MSTLGKDCRENPASGGRVWSGGVGTRFLVVSAFSGPTLVTVSADPYGLPSSRMFLYGFVVLKMYFCPGVFLPLSKSMPLGLIPLC